MFDVEKDVRESIDKSLKLQGLENEVKEGSPIWAAMDHVAKDCIVRYFNSADKVLAEAEEKKRKGIKESAYDLMTEKGRTDYMNDISAESELMSVRLLLRGLLFNHSE